MSLGLAFKALNDKTRRDILEMLREKDLAAGEIGEKFNIIYCSDYIGHYLFYWYRYQYNCISNRFTKPTHNNVQYITCDIRANQ